MSRSELTDLLAELETETFEVLDVADGGQDLGSCSGGGTSSTTSCSCSCWSTSSCN